MKACIECVADGGGQGGEERGGGGGLGAAYGGSRCCCSRPEPCVVAPIVHEEHAVAPISLIIPFHNCLNAISRLGCHCWCILFIFEKLAGSCSSSQGHQPAGDQHVPNESLRSQQKTCSGFFIFIFIFMSTCSCLFIVKLLPLPHCCHCLCSFNS